MDMSDFTTGGRVAGELATNTMRDGAMFQEARSSKQLDSLTFKPVEFPGHACEYWAFLDQ